MKTAKVTEKVKVLISLEDGMDNKQTLEVTSDDFGVLHYHLYGSWDSSGTPMSLSNMLTREPCPASIGDYETVDDLVEAIHHWVEPSHLCWVAVRFAKAISK